MKHTYHGSSEAAHPHCTNVAMVDHHLGRVSQYLKAHLWVCAGSYGIQKCPAKWKAQAAALKLQ